MSIEPYFSSVYAFAFSKIPFHFFLSSAVIWIVLLLVWVVKVSVTVLTRVAIFSNVSNPDSGFPFKPSIFVVMESDSDFNPFWLTPKDSLSPISFVNWITPFCEVFPLGIDSHTFPSFKKEKESGESELSGTWFPWFVFAFSCNAL